MERAAKKWVLKKPNKGETVSKKEHALWTTARRGEHKARAAYTRSKREAAKLKSILQQQIHKKEEDVLDEVDTSSGSTMSHDSEARDLVAHGLHRLMVKEPSHTQHEEAPFHDRLEKLAIQRRQ